MKTVYYHIMRTFVLVMVILTSLGFYRSTIQPKYHWGLLVIEGTGTGGDYINLISLFVLSWISLLFITWNRRKWYYIFPVLLTGICFYFTLKTYLGGEKDLTFNGDALNIHINLGFVMVMITLIAFLATLYWSYLDYKNFKKTILRRMSDRIKISLAIGIILTPVILFEFSHGDGVHHINSDRVAVVLTILQGFLFYYISRFRPKSALKKDLP